MPAFIIHFTRIYVTLPQLISSIVNQANLAGEANLASDMTLLLGREARVTARKDFATLVDEAT